MNELESNPQTPEANGLLIPLGAGEKARAWLGDLLDKIYQAHGQQVMNNPLVAGLKPILPMVGMMLPAAKPLAGLLSTLEASGPSVLVANVKITDQDAVDMLAMFYAALVDGYREILGVELEAE